MPDVPPIVAFIITLHNRCRTYRALPVEGGVLDQPEWLMELFDAIEGAAAKVRAERAEDSRREAEMERMALELRAKMGR